MEIYCATNTVNGKRYVGKTHTTWQERWKGHLGSVRRGSKCPFHCAIRKYGAAAFETQRICLATPETIDALEKFHIEKLKSNQRGFSYNLTNGGDGVCAPMSKAMKRKISKTLTGKPLSAATRAKLYPIPPEVREKIRKSLIGKTATKKTRKKMSLAKKRAGTLPPSRIGTVHSQETKDKIAKAHTGLHHGSKARKAMRENHKGMEGLTHSSETKEKMRLAAKNRAAQTSVTMKKWWAARRRSAQGKKQTA
jgi:group I intron endonuclease